MKYKWLMFDADGTLFDYDKAEITALRRSFEDIDRPFDPDTLATYRRINAKLWQDFEAGRIAQDRLKVKRFERLLESLGIEADAARFSLGYLRHLSNCPDLLDGAEDVVRCLAGSVRMILITNGLKEVQRPRIGMSAINDFFVDLVISEEVGSAKPHAGIFDEAFARMGNPRKADVLIVGDSLSSDIKGGNDYGIDTCWYNPDKRPRDPAVECRHEIVHLNELPGLVK